jgi:ABC-type sulfate transport system permease component
MKRGTTLFLKIAVILIGTPVLALCIFGLPMLAKEATESNSEFAYALYGILIVMYVSAIPFFVALYQAFKLLNYIDKNKAFSEISVKALKNIKYCANTISGIYVVGMPFFFIIAELDDAPGAILVGILFIFAPIVIAVFAAVLQKLLQEAINIKSENDLMV